MSKAGDVVWAYGTTWVRDEGTAYPYAKNWWWSVTQSVSTLAELKRHADFRWLVRDAQPVELEAERAAFQRGSEHGQGFERAAIVAWLRSDYIRSLPAYMFTPDKLADGIESGEHLRGDDEC